MSTATEEFGKIIAFYSFKGGTGRSMALANVACILAQERMASNSVLMVDWDLEAPGLHRYFRKHMYGAFQGSDEIQEKAPGLIDLFIDLRDRIDRLDLPAPQDYESATALLRDVPLSDYVVVTDIPNLYLLKSGHFDRNYAARVSTFAWLDLYSRSPFLLRAFAERLAQEFKYVLIDSRTGLTDTSGICAMLMPEILVTVFTPNLQSLTGVVDLIREAGRYRAQSDDLRPLVVYPLPSRIEASEPSLRNQWRYGDSRAGIEGFQAAFEEAFEEVYGLAECRLGPYFDDVQIQHVPRYAYGEETAVLVEESRDRFSLTRSYQRFAKRLSNGRLPWLDTETAEEDADEAGLPTPPVDSKRQEHAADAYLQRVYSYLTFLEETSRFYTQLARFAYVLGVVTIAAALFFTWVGSSTINTIVALIVAGIVAILAPSHLRREITQRSRIDDLKREVARFTQKVPPYDTDDALQRLKKRLDPILLSGDTKGTPRKTGKVFISYRRDDSIGYAGRLYEMVKRQIGDERVFMDVDSIQLGEDFVKVLESAVSSANVVLVMINRNWLTATDSYGRRRIDDPRDFVRIELAAALRTGTRVIPVLVGGAVMPPELALPDELKPLASRNAIELSDTRWEADVQRLTEAIEDIANR